MDQFINSFFNTEVYPSMEQVVIIGHSLGAQFAQRYAIMRPQQDNDDRVRYWVGNPGSLCVLFPLLFRSLFFLLLFSILSCFTISCVAFPRMGVFLEVQSRLNCLRRALIKPRVAYNTLLSSPFSRRSPHYALQFSRIPHISMRFLSIS